MALKTSLRLIARRIAEAVRATASAQGLAPGDYALVGTYNEKTEHISLILGTDRPVDHRRWYSDTLQEIRKLFPEFPQITMFIGLVIRQVHNFDEIYWGYGAAEDEQDLTELLERS